MSSFHTDLNFISSVCSNFADSVNESGEMLCGQDAYEVLTIFFGDEFSEEDLRRASSKHHDELAECLRSVLEVENATPELAKRALEQAVRLWR
jgi:hypothetical protein